MKQDAWCKATRPWRAVAVHAVAMTPLVCRTRTVWGRVKTQVLVARRVHVSGPACSKEHLDADDDEDGRHGYEARHCGIALVPEVGKTWVGERLEGGGQEMDKGGGYEDAGAEVSGYEEELVGDGD
jgi:hypothetical protein